MKLMQIDHPKGHTRGRKAKPPAIHAVPDPSTTALCGLDFSAHAGHEVDASQTSPTCVACQRMVADQQ